MYVELKVEDLCAMKIEGRGTDIGFAFRVAVVDHNDELDVRFRPHLLLPYVCTLYTIHICESRPLRISTLYCITLHSRTLTIHSNSNHAQELHHL
jgi:hypothetical protein